MASPTMSPITKQAGYDRLWDCEPCWVRGKNIIPATGRWGRMRYCDDCRRKEEIDDDEWEPLDRTNAMPKPGAVDYAEVKRKPEPADDPAFSASQLASQPDKVSSRSHRQPLPDQIDKPAGICTRTERCPKPFGHTGRCPKNLPKVPKAPKETWQVPASSTATPAEVSTKLGAAERLGKEIRSGLGGKARHARGEKQQPPAWALQFRELAEEEYAAIVPQRFLQKELEPIVEAINKKHAELRAAGEPVKVRIVIDVPHHTNSRHFRDRVSRYMRLRKVHSHTEQVARTSQIIVTAPPEKLPWGKRANGKQAT